MVWGNSKRYAQRQDPVLLLRPAGQPRRHGGQQQPYLLLPLQKAIEQNNISVKYLWRKGALRMTKETMFGDKEILDYTANEI